MVTRLRAQPLGQGNAGTVQAALLTEGGPFKVPGSVFPTPLLADSGRKRGNYRAGFRPAGCVNFRRIPLRLSIALNPLITRSVLSRHASCRT